MKLKDKINIMSDFQFAINIGYDLYGDNKIKNYIPTTSAIEIIEDIMLSMSPTSNDRSRIFIGAYGKGKSHLALVLISLLFRKEKGLFDSLLSMICETKPELCKYIKNYLNNDKRMLPVVIQGSSRGIQQSLMYELNKSLHTAGLEDIMPETYFKAAINTINTWKNDYPNTYKTFEKEIGCSVTDFISELHEFNISYYENFKEIYPKLTSGSEFNPISNINVIELYNDVNEKIKERGYSGIFVVYDEFSKFLEGNLNKTSPEEIKILQDFAENCSRSKGKQLHIMLISHQSILNYVDKLPKMKIDAWKAVSNRFKTIELNTSAPQMYELMSRVIDHNEEWYKDFTIENKKIFEDLYTKWHSDKVFANLNVNEIEKVIYGCYPLEPITTFLLPNISERVAQNERTVFTFLSSSGQKNTLYDFLEKDQGKFPLLTPDYIFDYFEPLFKTEGYNKPIHKYWKTAYAALNKLKGQDLLEKKIIKTIALIYIYDHFEILPPDMNTIISIYNGHVNDIQDVIKALTSLTQSGIIRKLDNRNYLRITEHTEINVENKINDIVSQRASTVDIKSILNHFAGDRVVYPNAYNDDNEIIRYFNFKFITSEDVLNTKNWDYNLDNIDGDGILYAIIPTGEQNIKQIEKNINISQKQIVFILPKEQQNIYNTAVKYDAVKYIIENTNDEVLAEELTYSLNDLTEALNAYVDMYLRPELGLAKYYNSGKELLIRRRSVLSRKISDICEIIYKDCPIINNEVINKNVISSQALNSRNKVVAGILENDLSENLGLVGTGQDISFMRSTLKSTGILLSSEDNKHYLKIENLEDERLQKVLDIIKNFIINSSVNEGLCFSQLYQTLTHPSNQIGLKKGVIPIYLATVLHYYKKYAVILKGQKELEINARLLDSINENPSDYIISLEKWDSDKEEYIGFLKDLFAKYISEGEEKYNSFEFIARGMQRWLMQLPKNTKETKDYYIGNDKFKPIKNKVLKFRNILNQPELNAREFLFNKIFEICGYNEFTIEIKSFILDSKNELEQIQSNLIHILEQELKAIFAKNNINSKASLASILKDWTEQFSEDVLSHMYSESENAILKVCLHPTNDTQRLIESLAKSATSLRIEDWNNITISGFFTAIKKFKENIEKYHSKLNLNKNNKIAGSYKISFIDEKGNETFRTFEKAEYSKIGKLMYNDAESMIFEYGESLSACEKRQVLVDVINKLLG